MRMIIAAGAILVALSSFAAVPAQAQQGSTYMWCTAWTEGAAAKAFYYSAFFAAGAWEAERKALAFKVEVEKVSAS